MRYQDFLNEAVERAIKAATEDYTQRPDRKSSLEGSLAGLKACRDKSPPQLNELLERAYKVHRLAFHRTNLDRYWRITCFMHEVEWICNVVSVALVNMDIPPIVHPTMRAAMVASEIMKQTEASN